MITEAGSAGVGGVLHCLHRDRTRWRRTALAAGWYVSFSGIVTFKKWTDVELLRLVPGDRLLVESDSPYLAPVPHQRKEKRAGVGLAHGREARGSPRSTIRWSWARRAANAQTPLQSGAVAKFLRTLRVPYR